MFLSILFFYFIFFVIVANPIDKFLYLTNIQHHIMNNFFSSFCKRDEFAFPHF